MFAYCKNNPANCIDPSGHTCIFENDRRYYGNGLVEYTDSGTGTPTVYYSSANEAAHVAGVDAALYTQKTNCECAYGIYKTGKKFTVSQPVYGEHDYVDTSSLIDNGLVAIVHSHPYCNGHDSNHFSKEKDGVLYGDALVAYNNHITMYLAAPNGTLQKMTVSDWFIVGNIYINEETIAWDLPKDNTLFDCIGVEGR